MHRTERGVDVAGDVILRSGPYAVRHMQMTWPRLRLLWEQLQKFRTLFSDLTRGDFDNFLRYVGNETTLWLEIDKGGELVGIVTCEGMHRIVDMDAHIVFVDRDTSSPERVAVCKALVMWLFDTFPLQRITVQPPTMYYATIRLARSVGFVQEGKKRKAMLVGGRWVDQLILGITREEAMARCRSSAQRLVE